MTEFLAILLPAILLLAVTAAQLYTVFEPYYALNTAEAADLMDYHARDPKLQAIADYWGRQLCPSSSTYREPEHPSHALAAAVLKALARHRFLVGDDPRKLSYNRRTSGILFRAMRESGIMPTLHAPAADLLITAKAVRTVDGSFIWRGEPREYVSRFADFYAEP